jgi:urea carboxylase
VHPGYGFLAEDASFAAIVEHAGLAFIGPTPDQMVCFGQKDRARAAAAAAGVPLLPGSGALDDPATAVAAARVVGFPFLVKSVAGGGGIGMVECTDPNDVVDTVERAMRQSQQAFGAPHVFLERVVDRARHVEVQVFGDGKGRVVVLGERDCSAQRRRQKVMEEAPAPNLDDDTRAALFDAARRVLEPMRYRSAGTVEFVIDADTGELAFLEVNTRLQVEHGVTEAILGVDLVEWMVRLAAGDDAFLDTFLDAGLPRPRGHAIEVRLYAEDPAKGWLPSAGELTAVEWPPDVRVDTWVRTGTEVTAAFDPLLAKLVVTGSTRADALERMRDVLTATRLEGIETNRELLASFLASGVVERGQIVTTTLDGHQHTPRTVDVIAGGASTTVQSLPGRLGYWEVGVPPSGPMDDLSFTLANARLGNDGDAPGLECTVAGPTLRCNAATWVCLTGARMATTLDGRPVPWGTPVAVAAGAVLELGTVQGPGLRAYVAFGGGLAVPEYLGSTATFTLGGFGGHGGRELRAGDVLHLADASHAPPAVGAVTVVPELTHEWEIAVLDGPHSAPEFFTGRDIDELFRAAWQVHHHSSRTGVRLVGPKPEWARADGGDAGLHPSNIHDTPYVPGAVDFTGDMPIILGPDGPSLGGFVCPVTVVAAERWKVGQLAPGDRVRFVRAGAPSQGILGASASTPDRPEVTFRQSGDRALLVEFGPMTLDLDLRLRAHALAEWIAAAELPGIVDVTPGIRSLQVRVDGEQQTVASMLDALRHAEPELAAAPELEVPSREVHLPLSWDDPATRDAISRYMRSVRDDAPWCPWNIEFIRRINGLDSVDDVHRIVFDAEYLVLGLGDVYLGAPVAVPVDPRHRLVTTKYNPARTWTPENAVGIGGAYLCVYGMEGPGGYQLVGRTVPVWSRHGNGPAVDPETPWLLRHFDRIRWFPVDADTLLDMRAEARAGRLELEITDGTFSNSAHRRFVTEHHDSIEEFRVRRQAAYDAERAAWARDGELDAAASADAALEQAPGTTVGELGPLPVGASILGSPLTGCVASVHRAATEQVRAGEPVVTIEAMKTEHRVAAPEDSVVDRIVCHEGEMVTSGAPLAVLVPNA